MHLIFLFLLSCLRYLQCFILQPDSKPCKCQQKEFVGKVYFNQDWLQPAKLYLEKFSTNNHGYILSVSLPQGDCLKSSHVDSQTEVDFVDGIEHNGLPSCPASKKISFLTHVGHRVEFHFLLKTLVNSADLSKAPASPEPDRHSWMAYVWPVFLMWRWICII